MRYLGGKFRIRKQIGKYLNSIRQSNQTYWEPFVGSAWVLSEIEGIPNFASDIHAGLIEMWKELQLGWQPPTNITEKEYRLARKGSFPPALTAFIGFGCSWGGKWWGGYARDKHSDRNYAASARNGLLRKINLMPPVTFFHADFMSCDPPAENCLVYCDPPYAGVTEFNGTPTWNSSKFWGRVRQLQYDHTIIVSEYVAPDDFRCVLEMPVVTDMPGRQSRTERLFRHDN